MAPVVAPQQLGKREAILRYISDYRRMYGYSPSYQEIGQACGMTSKSLVVYWLNKLCKERLLWRAQYVARSVQLTLRGRAVLEGRAS